MKQQPQPAAGDIFAIPLGNESYAFAQALENPLWAFYDLQMPRVATVDEIMAAPVAFQLWVHNDAWRTGRWRRVGHAALDESSPRRAVFFKQDALNPRRCSLYQNGQERPASPEECVGLERAAVWDPEHVEDRLRDRFDVDQIVGKSLRS